MWFLSILEGHTWRTNSTRKSILRHHIHQAIGVGKFQHYNKITFVTKILPFLSISKGGTGKLWPVRDILLMGHWQEVRVIIHLEVVYQVSYKSTAVTKMCHICQLERGKRNPLHEILFLRHVQEVLGQLWPKFYAATLTHLKSYRVPPKSLRIHIYINYAKINRCWSQAILYYNFFNKFILPLFGSFLFNFFLQKVVFHILINIIVI